MEKYTQAQERQTTRANSRTAHDVRRQTTCANPRTAHNVRRQTTLRRKRHRRRIFARLAINFVFLVSTFLCVLLLCTLFLQIPVGDFSSALFSHAPKHSPIQRDDWADADNVPDLPKELSKLLEHNPETALFVQEYPNRETYLKREIDLSSDEELLAALDAGEVPLLMQWDLRWGYAPYGGELIGLAGCGPTCLSMACIYLTGDLSNHPAAMADLAYREGFYTEYGTDWSLWTDGVSLVGLKGETLSLSESAMCKTLDNGGLIICSMRPGDFTTTGHFILLRGYDENGFYVCDPNSRGNSEKQWTYKQLSPQIKNLWGLWKS